MKRLFCILGFLIRLNCFGQDAIVKGRIVDTNSSDIVSGAYVVIADSDISSLSNDEGLFDFSNVNLPKGEQILIVSKTGYKSQRISITIQKGSIINLDPILLREDLREIDGHIGLISLSDNELDQDDETTYNISGLLSASKDIFLRAAAYDFSATFFRPRGLDNTYGKILINGIEMNKQNTGRPEWSNWGGMNDVQRSREFTMAFKANEYTFGDVAGTTNIIMRASQYRRGGRLSFASSNKTYRGRLMGSYHSGILKSGWAYSVLLARRYGEEGNQDGTFYNANSFFASVEKQITKTSSLNLSVFYTPNQRGRSTAITDEVWRLKGITYNPNWGYQEGKKRSSRVREVKEPVIMINHFWNIGNKTTLNTNVGYQFGKIGDTRLDYGRNRNPAGNYYQRLPSYFLQNQNPSPYEYRQAYLAEKGFIQDGQIDWESLYAGNQINGNSIYSLQEDRIDEKRLMLNTILNTSISQRTSINGAFGYRKISSENYVHLKDLLGGSGYMDIDNFGTGGIDSNSDLQNINRIVTEGERLKYNYNIDTSVFSSYAQSVIKYKKVDLHIGFSASLTNYKRIGLYQNGYFPEEGRSLGSSDLLNFTNFGIKGGSTYKITGRHLLDLNIGYITKAPNIRSSFANVRQNNDIVVGLQNEKIQSLDISYNYRSPIVKARFTGYYINFKDQNKIGFFFTQNALGNEETSAFVQEIVTGIAKRNIGIEFGIEAQMLPTFKLKAAVAVGQNLHINNPNLYLAGDDFGADGNDIATQGIRPVYLKDFHDSGGPERAYQLGFEYRAPDFWWVGVTANHYSNAYINISNLRRTSDFYTDVDGQPFNDYNEDISRLLLKQEQFDDYFLLNLVGGKSWKVRNYYIGLFGVINNLLDQNYKTGGFEDSRRASYRQQVEEYKRDTPIFGNRYFFGRGISYYANVYVRF